MATKNKGFPLRRSSTSLRTLSLTFSCRWISERACNDHVVSVTATPLKTPNFEIYGSSQGFAVNRPGRFYHVQMQDAQQIDLSDDVGSNHECSFGFRTCLYACSFLSLFRGPYDFFKYFLYKYKYIIGIKNIILIVKKYYCISNLQLTMITLL